MKVKRLCNDRPKMNIEAGISDFLGGNSELGMVRQEMGASGMSIQQDAAVWNGACVV